MSEGQTIAVGIAEPDGNVINVKVPVNVKLTSTNTDLLKTIGQQVSVALAYFLRGEENKA